MWHYLCGKSTRIHFDTASAILLSHAQVKYREFFPRSWYYVNGDLWVIAPQLFTFPFAVLLKDQVLARTLGSLFAVIFVVFCVIFFEKKITKSGLWIIALPIIHVFMVGAYDDNLYQVSYSPQLLLTLLGIVLYSFLPLHNEVLVCRQT